MRHTVAAATLALLAATGAADARQHYPARGHRILPASAAALDNFTAPSGAYSFRKLRSAYAGPAVRIRRASDNLETDINFLGCTGFTGCPWDEAAAGAHCAATTCFGRTWYDQSGAVLDLVQATTANQPQLVFNCTGTLPCWQTTVTTQNLLTAANFTPATGIVSLSAVAMRVGAATTGLCNFIQANGTVQRLAGAAVNQWAARGGGAGTLTVTAANDVWHAGLAVITNTAAGVVGIDGTETTGSMVGTTAAGLAGITGGAGVTTCRFAEAMFWDNYILTAGERTALQTNQRSFWGTP